MNRRVAVLAAVTLTAAALTGCTGKTDTPKAGEGKTATIEISYDDLLKQQQISRSVHLEVGDILRVDLGSNASTGYQWADEMLLSDPKVMTQTGHETIAPDADRPGAPGREVWTLKATAPGTTTVSTTYGQPWPGGQKESWVFSANVEIG